MADKINFEMATAEFERFAETMCIDIDVSRMKDEDREDFEGYKKTVVDAICRGSLVINDRGEPVYTPQRSENNSPLVFKELTGANLAAGDKLGKGREHSKLFETMGSMTETHAGRFSKMVMSDLKVCQAIIVLFLA